MANNVNNNETVNNNVSNDNGSVETNSSPSSNTNVSNNSGAKNNSFLNNIGLFGNRRNGYGSGIGNIFGRNKKNSSPMKNGSNSYQNRERLNRARAERNNPYKGNTGNKNNNGTDNNKSGATGSTTSNTKEKGILDTAKDNLNVLGAGASLAGSHMDNLRNKASTARHPLKAAKRVVANKIKMTIMTWISGIAIGCAPYLLGIFVAIIVVLFVLGLLGDVSSGNILSQTGVCSYNVDGKSVSDVKIRLLNCDGKSVVLGEGLIDFETYITGAVYQESGDS